MKKFILGLLCLSLLFITIETRANEEIEIQLQNNTVSLTIITTNRSASCSGVILTNTFYMAEILTAKHCTSIDGSILINDKYIVKIIQESKSHDLALVTIFEHIPNQRPVIIARENARMGQKVYHFGYPQGKPFFSYGDVLWIGRSDAIVKLHIIGGCSGGGIVDWDGKLVGIAVWKMIDGYMERFDITGFESLKDIKDFFREIDYKIYK